MKRIHTAIYLALGLLLTCNISHAQSTNKNNHQKEADMSETQKNKETVRKVYEQALNKRNLGLLQELISPDYTGPNGIKGTSAFAYPPTMVIKAFPDVQWHIEDIVADGDKVMLHWKLQGTHMGPFNNYEATGKPVTNEGMAVYTLKNGKIISTQILTDRLGFLQQLEVLPAEIGTQRSKDNVCFIDKFLVPAAAANAFRERTKINRAFIKKLPGFITDAAYEYTNENGDLVCITVARWANKEALNKAKEAVQAEYQKQGFDPAEFMKSMHITIDRGIYTELQGQ